MQHEIYYGGLVSQMVEVSMGKRGQTELWQRTAGAAAIQGRGRNPQSPEAQRKSPTELGLSPLRRGTTQLLRLFWECAQRRVLRVPTRLETRTNCCCQTKAKAGVLIRRGTTRKQGGKGLCSILSVSRDCPYWQALPGSRLARSVQSPSLAPQSSAEKEIFAAGR